jgi:nicotinate-nucleotide adenylyltransferase
MKVGIFGGTFNPIHIGHLLIAEQACDKLKLDKLYFVPVNLPAHKRKNGLILAHHRLTMVKLAIKNNRRLSVSDMEIKRGGTSYSVDTLRIFKAAFPKKTKFYFIMGSDSLNDLKSWKDADKIPALCKLAVFDRPGCPIRSRFKNFIYLGNSAMDISSSMVRQFVRKGLSVRYLVRKPVIDYIKMKRLYL